MNNSNDGSKTGQTQQKTSESIAPSIEVPAIFACKRGRQPKQSKVQKRLEMYDRRVNKNPSSASRKQASSIKDPSSEDVDDTPHYFTNGPGDELVPVDDLALAATRAHDRDQMFQVVRLYHVDGIDWAVCDDCAINRFPRAFEGSRIVARVGCAHCRCQNALRDESAMQRWLALGRPPINLADPPRGA